jgi:hypothetical protein
MVGFVLEFYIYFLISDLTTSCLPSGPSPRIARPLWTMHA